MLNFEWIFSALRMYLNVIAVVVIANLGFFMRNRSIFLYMTSHLSLVDVLRCQELNMKIVFANKITCSNGVSQLNR